MMAKICPLTNKTVIYLTCAECDQKTDCRAGKLNNIDKTDNLKKILQQSDRYRDFTMIDEPVPFSTMFEDKDIVCVQVHSAEILGKTGEQDIIGFCGAFSWINHELKPLDGDIYNENVRVLGYKWFKNVSGDECLNILVGDDW